MDNYFGPLIMLTILAVSALACALITLSYPFTLWQKEKPKDALKVVSYTALWTIGLVIALLLSQSGLV